MEVGSLFTIIARYMRPGGKEALGLGGFTAVTVGTGPGKW